jgi:hypothetical protein
LKHNPFFCPKIAKWGRVPKIFFGLESEYYLGAHAKFKNPMINPSGRKVSQGERREKERKKPLIVNT